jgi:hypothetical protein
VVPATVTAPSKCTVADATERVRFEVDGTTREGTLSGCGHNKGEQVRVAVPPGDQGADALTVRLAATMPGQSDLRSPVGLALLVLSCASGGIYAFLVARGPRVAMP